MNILLHACCAHCLTYPYQVLTDSGFNVTAFWYNPNIHPFMEHKARREALQQLSSLEDIDIIFGKYDFIKYLQQQLQTITKPTRCEHCYRYRLEATAKTAKKEGFDMFTTTLLSSQFQYHMAIKKIGEELADDIGIPFYYKDFRDNSSHAKAAIKRYGLYRQNYCGCLISEWERFDKKSHSETHQA